MCVCERERETETDRQTDRQTEADRQTDGNLWHLSSLATPLWSRGAAKEEFPKQPLTTLTTQTRFNQNPNNPNLWRNNIF